MEIIDLGANNMNESIFCKIASGEIPCMKVYEDNLTLAHYIDTETNGVRPNKKAD